MASPRRRRVLRPTPVSEPCSLGALEAGRSLPPTPCVPRRASLRARVKTSSGELLLSVVSLIVASPSTLSRLDVRLLTLHDELCARFDERVQLVNLYAHWRQRAVRVLCRVHGVDDCAVDDGRPQRRWLHQTTTAALHRPACGASTASTAKLYPPRRKPGMCQGEGGRGGGRGWGEEGGGAVSIREEYLKSV